MTRRWQAAGLPRDGRRRNERRVIFIALAMAVQRSAACGRALFSTILAARAVVALAVTGCTVAARATSLAALTTSARAYPHL